MKKTVKHEALVATFSIVGADPETGEVGVAVQSKFLAVGSVVPWAKANVGAVATQSFVNTSYGPKGLALLEEGLSPEKVISELTANDPGKGMRQVAVINAQGEVSAFTGNQCFAWAGHKTGKHHSAQGNILVSEETVTAMSEAFEQTEGPLAERLLAGLAAAQRAGGDSRGKQSAALYVVQEGAGYGGYNDVKIDLRVDDHPEPIEELERLYGLHQTFASSVRHKAKLEGDVFEEVKDRLIKLGLLEDGDYPVYEGEVKQALQAFVLQEDLEEHWTEEPIIDLTVLTYLREQ